MIAGLKNSSSDTMLQTSLQLSKSTSVDALQRPKLSAHRSAERAPRRTHYPKVSMNGVLSNARSDSQLCKRRQRHPPMWIESQNGRDVMLVKHEDYMRYLKACKEGFDPLEKLAKRNDHPLVEDTFSFLNDFKLDARARSKSPAATPTLGPNHDSEGDFTSPPGSGSEMLTPSACPLDGRKVLKQCNLIPFEKSKGLKETPLPMPEATLVMPDLDLASAEEDQAEESECAAAMPKRRRRKKRKGRKGRRKIKSLLPVPPPMALQRRPVRVRCDPIAEDEVVDTPAEEALVAPPPMTLVRTTKGAKNLFKLPSLSLGRLGSGSDSETSESSLSPVSKLFRERRFRNIFSAPKMKLWRRNTKDKESESPAVPKLERSPRCRNLFQPETMKSGFMMAGPAMTSEAPASRKISFFSRKRSSVPKMMRKMSFP